MQLQTASILTVPYTSTRLAFRAYCADVRRLSPHTIRAYDTGLDRWQQFLNSRDVRNFEDASAADLLAFTASLGNVKPATVRLRLSAVCALNDYLNLTGALAGNLARLTPRPSLSRHARQLPDALTVERLRESLAGPMRLRDRALFACMADLALRVGEIVSLTIDAPDRASRTLHVVGKGRHQRTLAVCDATWQDLAAWMDLRAHLMARRPGRALFYGQGRRGHLHQHSVRQLLYQACDRIGVRRYGPHDLRHYRARALRESRQLDAFEISAYLGHAGTVTDRYVHADPARVNLPQRPTRQQLAQAQQQTQQPGSLPPDLLEQLAQHLRQPQVPDR